MRALRVLLAMVASATVLFGGAYAGGAFPVQSAHAQAAPSPQRPDGLERYDRPSAAGEIAVGDALEVNGQPMQLSLFYTSDPAPRVIAFYMKAFLDRGLLPVTSFNHVSVFDPHDGLQRFITAVPQPQKQTLVMIGIANPRKPPRLIDGAKGAGFPVPDENRAYLGYRSEDAGARAESGQFVTSESVEQVSQFYREKLPALGWREQGSSPAMLNFEKQGETLSVGVQALEEKSGAAVFVNHLQGDATR
jgi:hypothetical protein